MNRFPGKVVAVTGGAHGIGRATALRFASEGANVAVLDVRDGEGEQVATECDRAGGQGRDYNCDVTDPGAVAAAVRASPRTWRRSTCCTRTPGGCGREPCWRPLDEWCRLLPVNVTGMYLVVREVVPVIQARGGGAIVTTGSMSGLFGEPALTAYTASKAAVVNLTRCLAIDFAMSGIRVNCVCPGWVDTGFNDPQFAHDHVRRRHRGADRRTVPMRRQGRPKRSPPRSPSWRPGTPRTSPARRWSSTAACCATYDRGAAVRAEYSDDALLE